MFRQEEETYAKHREEEDHWDEEKCPARAADRRPLARL